MRYVFGDYELDTQVRELYRRGVPVPLTPKVYAVLAYLLHHHDRLVLKEELLEQIWPDTYVDDSAVKRCILAVRRAIGDQPAAPCYIKTLRSQGYRFIATVTVYDHPAPRPAVSVASPLTQTSTPSAPASPETTPHAAPEAQAAVSRRLDAVVSPGPAEARRCAVCQQVHSNAAQFCTACGAPMATSCPHCGQVVALPATFCPGCGQRLTTGRPLMASALAIPVLPTEHPFAGERKLVTVLCGIVAHASALIEQLGLDTLHGVMQAVYALASAEAHQYGGTLQPLPGEGFLVLFGAPVAQEDHARRAILAALGLQRRLRVHPSPLQLSSGEVLAIHLALHTGQAVVGQRGADPHATTMVVGNPMTLATALARRAAPGTILASAVTLRLVHGEIHTTRSRSLHMDEYPTPVPVAEILQAIPQQQLPVGPAGRARSPFIGRTTELAVLHTRLAWAERGQGQVVGVLGEPGIGKSRLLAEFRHSIVSRAVTYLQGHCHSYGSTMPYLPLLDLWRRAWDIGEADSAAVITAKVQMGLQALGLEPDAWTPSLLPLLDIEMASEQSAGMSPDEHKTRTFEALHQLCLASSRQRPCVLEIENLHWIDATSDAYLEALVERLAGAPILLLVSFRPGYRTPWLDKSYATQLALQPLEQQESRRVLRAVRRNAPLSAALEQHLLAKAEGNPFFLEELAHTVVENRGNSPELVVPDTVQAVLAARIDRLPPTEKQLLQIAAVIGTEVSFPLLHTLAGVSERALQRPLAHLQAVELLYETRMARERTYVFKHVLTHEVTYGSLLQEQRRTLHRRIVVALETLYVHHLAEQSDRLAHHALHGEVWDKASHYFWQAGTRAMARSAHREAMACFEQALAATRHLPEDRERRAQYIDLCFDLRNALLPLGEHTRILAILHEAEPLAESLDDARRLGWLSCYMSTQGFMLGEYDRAIASGQRALALATTCGDLALHVTTHLRLGQAHHALGNYQQAIEALKWNVASLTGALLQERFGLAGLPSVHSRTWLGWCLAETGAFPEGIACGEEALRVAEAVERPYDLLVAYCGLGLVYLHQGNLASAVPMLERGLSLCQTTPIPLLFSTIASLLGTAYALCGRISEALPLLEQAVAQDTTRRLLASSSIAGVRLSQAYLLARRIEEAQQLAGQVLDLARTRKEQGHEAYALWLLGEIYTQCLPPQVEPAATCYRQALALAEALAMHPLLAHCHLGLGLLYSQGPCGAQARAELAAAIKLFQSMDMGLWLPRAEAALAQVV